MLKIRIVALSLIYLSLTLAAHRGAVVFAQSGVSNQDKAQACKDAADKRNLTGDDRKNFLQSCASKAAGNQPANTQQTKVQQAANDKLDDMSQRDKMNVCKNLADKKNLNGADRRSYLKDCMEKANPK